MSQQSVYHIECPVCHKTSDAQFWDSVNVDLNPELREKIFNNEIFRFSCPECGASCYIKTGMIYHDMTHKFMLFFDFDRPFETSGDIDIPELFKGMEKDYSFRAVYGLDEFKEKILILENGLHDIAVEHMKYMIEHVIMPDPFKDGNTLHFEKVVDPDKNFPYGRICFSFYDDETEHVKVVSFAMDNYYEHKLACEIDPRMKPEVNCPCIDREWMAFNLIKG